MCFNWIRPFLFLSSVSIVATVLNRQNKNKKSCSFDRLYFFCSSSFPLSISVCEIVGPNNVQKATQRREWRWVLDVHCSRYANTVSAFWLHSRMLLGLLIMNPVEGYDCLLHEWGAFKSQLICQLLNDIEPTAVAKFAVAVNLDVSWKIWNDENGGGNTQTDLHWPAFLSASVCSRWFKAARYKNQEH